MIIHITVGRLRRFASQVRRLGRVNEWALGAAHLLVLASSLTGKTNQEKKTISYVGITITKAAEIWHIPLALIRRRRRTSTTGRRLRNRRGRSLRRRDSGVRRLLGDIQAGLVRRTGRIPAGRGLLVGEAKLQTVWTTRGAAVGHLTRCAGGSDCDRRLPSVITAGRRGRTTIDDGRLRLRLHGFCGHFSCRRRLPMLRVAALRNGSGGVVRVGLVGGGVGVGACCRRRGEVGGGGSRSSGLRIGGRLSLRWKACLLRDRGH